MVPWFQVSWDGRAIRGIREIGGARGARRDDQGVSRVGGGEEPGGSGGKWVFRGNQEAGRVHKVNREVGGSGVHVELRGGQESLVGL